MSKARAGLTAAIAAAALAGCSAEPEPAAVATEAAPAIAPAAPAVPLPTPSETPEQAAASPATSAAGIPQAVQGRWGLVRADCTSTRGDAKGLLTIGPRKLEFYESVANLGAVQERGERRIRATFTFTGEGQTWTQDVLLDAQAGGDTLIRRDFGPDALPEPLEYTRC